jgi:hypothetical protein
MALGGLIIALLLALATPGIAHAAPQFATPQEPDDPLDTPTTLVSESSPNTFNEWTMGGGLLYWAQRCFGGEFRGDGYLKRMPVNGSIRRTLATVSPSFCVTFLSMAADEDGVFYFNDDASPDRIEHVPTASPYTPTTVYALSATSQKPRTDLEVRADYVYWGTTGNQILRARKDGTGSVETVANTGANVQDVMLVGDSVYWLDDSGFWQTTVTCGTPFPCPKEKLVTTSGDHLLYVPGTFFLSYSIYWVEDGSQEKIRRYACNFLIGSGLTCSASGALYTAPTFWSIGQLTTDNSGHLFWTENYFKIGDPADGRVMRSPTSGSSWSADEIAVNQPHIDRRMFADNRNIYFATVGGTPTKIMSLPFDATAIERDLAADKWEVTQGIQDTANDVSLVADKTTYVRVYGKNNSGPQAVAAEAYLYGTRSGSPLPSSPLRALNGVQNLAVGSGYNRARIDDGWLFRLPASWTDAGSVNLRAVVDPRQVYSDPNRGNNEKSGNVTFTGKAPVCTVFVPVRTHSPYASTSNPNFWPMMDLATRLWPTRAYWAYHQNSDVAETQVCWWGPFPHPCFGPYELPDDDTKVLISLNIRDFFSDDPDRCDDANAETHYVGMVHSDTNTNVDGGVELGVAFRDDNVAWVKFPAASDAPRSSGDWNFPDPGITLAHELGHNVGRKHVDCGGPENTDSGYPYPTDQLDNVGPDAHYGFDINSRTPIPPNGAKDLMSYCDPVWTSDYTWTAIMNKLNSAGAADAARAETVQPQVPDLPSVGNIVYVSGIVTPTTNQGELNYAWSYPAVSMSNGMRRKWQQAAAPEAGTTASQTDAPAANDYKLRLLDAGGAVLTERAVTPFEGLDGGGPSQGFFLTFPAPGGAVARMELMDGATVLAALEPGPGMPAVTVLEPHGGETFDANMTIVWEANDPDAGDDLLYSVQYSPDGGATWRAVATDLPGGDSNVVTLTLTSLVGLPGSAPDGGRIRVAASDGYNTGLGESAGFTVTNRKPEAHIVSPTPGQMETAGDTVILRGAAADEEDGGLSGASLSWTLDSAAAGTGEEVNVSGLAPGSYDVVLTAQDSKGATGTAQRALTISPLAPPLGSTPSMDGFCDDNAYTGGVTLQLKPYSNGGQATVHLLRTGDHLWACFSGMDQSSGGPGGFAGLRVDVNDSRDSLAQADDYGFFVGEDGSVFTYAGDGAGGFADLGPGGLAGQMSASGSLWQAELRIDKDVLGGWDHMVSMNLGHYWVRSQGDDYHWPYDSGWNQPDRWAKTALGDMPRLTGLQPDSATVGAPGFDLVVTGENFVDGAQVLWDGAALPTAFGDATVVTATVDAAKLGAAGVVTVNVRNPGSNEFVSNGQPFQVNNPRPAITGLSPSRASEHAQGFTLTVDGANFVNGATVYWNGAPLATTFVSDARLQASIPSTELSPAGAVGVSVVNPGPGGGASETVLFVIDNTQRILLPVVAR